MGSSSPDSVFLRFRLLLNPGNDKISSAAQALAAGDPRDRSAALRDVAALIAEHTPESPHVAESLEYAIHVARIADIVQPGNAIRTSLQHYDRAHCITKKKRK